MIFKDVATFVEGGDDGIRLIFIIFTETYLDDISAEAETVRLHFRGVARCDKSIKETQTEHGCMTPVSFQVSDKPHFILIRI